MVRPKKSILLMCVMVTFGLGVAPNAMATENIIENFAGTSPLCNPYMLITYADVDGNPTTGGYDELGNWTPNETQIILYAMQGDTIVNVDPYSGQIFFSHEGENCGESGWQTKKGQFAILFVDAMDPCWVWDDELTWKPRPIKEAEFRISHKELTNYSNYIGPDDPGNVVNTNPVLRVQALQEVDGVFNTVVVFEHSGASQFEQSVTLSNESGFSELLVSTDFVDNALEYLYLWDSIIPAEPDTPEGVNVKVCHEESWYPCPTGLCLWTNGIAPGVCVNFPLVTRAGDTSAKAQIHLPEWPALKRPVNFMTSYGDSYQIVTSAQYSGGATICIEYPDTVDESNLHLFHFQGGLGYGSEEDLSGWVEVPSSIDTEANKICGHVSTLTLYGPVAPCNTPVDSPVTVTAGDVTITFEEVTSPGETTITESDTGPDPPADFHASCIPLAYYNITTTATYSGIIKVCVSYDETVWNESNLHLFLFNYQDGTWEYVTTTVDTEANIICGEVNGEVTSLLKFLLATSAKAWNPEPVDGAMHADTWVNISWMPGGCAVSHDVYFGDNFDNVNDGTGGTFYGNQPWTFFVVGFPGFPYSDGLVPGVTYYWRVDEVEADGTTIHKGDVWSFMVPPKTAYNPDPPDGAEQVDLDVTLSWTAGFGAKLHTVFFGDNFDDVSDATDGILQGTTTYSPGTLKTGKTYYWRVYESDGSKEYEGDVWSFTTIP